MRIPSLLACVSLALCFSPASAQDSKPTSQPTSQPAKTALAGVLEAARKDKIKLEGRHVYFLGKNPGVALLEHETKRTKRGLEAIFSEHAPDGSFVRSTYVLDSAGKLLAIEIGTGTRDSYPDASRTQRFVREGKELAELNKTKLTGGRKKLPISALPMSVVMFVLPSLAKHLPASLEFVPVFESQVHGETMVLSCEATKDGARAAVLVSGQPAVTIQIDSKGAVTQMETPDGNVIKPVSEAKAKAILAKLRPA
ncbi:MAG: hypothetical protein JKY65_10705 [Planctomycetes bacterium]|nr:hypothetical protein [Planctomycetota bacterium]